MTLREKDRRYEGFTLIEILVVVGLIAILAAVTIIAINPAKNFQQTRDAQRSADVTAILNAVTQYTSEEGQTLATLIAATNFAGYDSADGGVVPDGIELCTSGTTPILSTVNTTDVLDPQDLDGDTNTAEANGVYDDIEESGGIDLVTVLVDEYIVAIPEDPSQASALTNGSIDTSYTMCVTSSGRITIAATPEQATAITVSR